MRSYRITAYPGDGIGQEVTAETLRVMDAVQDAAGDFRLEVSRVPWGSDYYHRHGKVVPDDYLDTLAPSDAIFLGAIGDPARIPDHVTLAPLIRIRQSFDQYACVRPARLFPGVRTPLAGKGPEDIDLVVIRENSEGEYVDNGGRFRVGTPDEFAVQTALHTRKGIERILRFGFRMAGTRRGHLTMITKSNAQRYGFVLWDQVLEQLRAEHPDIEVAKYHIDAAVMNMVRWPERFDVVVASNLFGDILTDLSGILAGGLGQAPSSNINPERRFPSMFEPVHGSAPDIAGQGIANPTAAILSGANMLRWLGEERAAADVERAVEATFAQGHGTPDLGGSLNTQAFTDQILGNLQV